MATLFEEVLAEVMVNIRRYAASLVRNERADDVAQDAYVILIRDRAEYELITDREAMISRLTGAGIKACWFVHRGQSRLAENKNVGLDTAQQQRPDYKIQGPQEALEEREKFQKLEAAVGELGPECRDLIRKMLAGQRVRDIWERTQPPGITLNAWQVQATRCVQKATKLFAKPAKGGKS